MLNKSGRFLVEMRGIIIMRNPKKYKEKIKLYLSLKDIDAKVNHIIRDKDNLLPSSRNRRNQPQREFEVIQIDQDDEQHSSSHYTTEEEEPVAGVVNINENLDEPSDVEEDEANAGGTNQDQDDADSFEG